MQKQSSLAEIFLELPISEQKRRISKLTDNEIIALSYDWEYFSRPSQQLPDGDWISWLILAGRGFGKTRTGAETVRQWIKTCPYVNLIGATSDDARDIMIEGESGILAICPKDERPDYLGHKSQLRWPNGAKSLIFTADKPDRFRGKQHGKLWMDEIASWRYPESFDQAMFGLRLGNNPQCIITTTPRPIKIIKELLDSPTTHTTRGSTYDNKQNLAKTFIDKIVEKYEGTRLGRQELHAEMLLDNPDALWQRDKIESLRVKEHPDLKRIIVAVDPSVTANKNSDETGIIVAGLGSDSHGYILADITMKGTPEQWANIVVNAYHKYKADRIIGEVNNGGDMIETIIRNKDKYISYTGVRATRGKYVRAEPISALYEQDKVHHVGCFPELEDQMCEWSPDSSDSPDRMDALVWALTHLMTKEQSNPSIRRL